MSTAIARDPFARADLMRQQVYTRETCAWCGNAKQTKTGRQFLYRYVWIGDGRMVSYVDPRRDHKVFCSVSCYRCLNW